MQYKLGVSCHTLHGVYDLHTLLEKVKKAGFHSVDFWLYRYSKQPGEDMLGDEWEALVRDADKAIKESGLIAGQAHCVWSTRLDENLDCPDPDETQIYKRSLIACQMMDCSRLIFHPVFYRAPVKNGDMRRRIMDRNVSWFQKLIPIAQATGVKIYLENTFDFGRFQEAEDGGYPFTTADEMLELQRRIGSPLVKQCLDTGHANLAGQDVPAMIRAYGAELNALHLNDNYGNIWPIYPDLHLFPGLGRLEWDGIFAALKEVNYKGILNIEPVGELKRMDPQVLDVQLKAAAQTLRLMAEKNGLSVET